VQAALGGRFTLGIGPSHAAVISDGLGIPFDRPAAHTREYIVVLEQLLDGHPNASYKGEIFRVATQLGVMTEPVPIVVAALGPVMLRIAGARTAGTITSWVGPRTLAEHIVPTITTAATDAGRPAPRVIVGLPVAVTDDPDAVRAALAPRLAFYDTLPSYKAMFDREGVTGPADLLILGDEAAVHAGLDRLADAGATDFAAQLLPAGPDSIPRTVDVLRSRL
jgi:F420-dependent oxidoreductase-like protein